MCFNAYIFNKNGVYFEYTYYILIKHTHNNQTTTMKRPQQCSDWIDWSMIDWSIESIDHCNSNLQIWPQKFNWWMQQLTCQLPATANMIFWPNPMLCSNSSTRCRCSWRFALMSLSHNHHSPQNLCRIPKFCQPHRTWWPLGLQKSALASPHRHRPLTHTPSSTQSCQTQPWNFNNNIPFFIPRTKDNTLNAKFFNFFIF